MRGEYEGISPRVIKLYRIYIGNGGKVNAYTEMV